MIGASDRTGLVVSLRATVTGLCLGYAFGRSDIAALVVTHP
ncbi:hypothetical protein [Halocatena pleomorpha]|nr:hypothetical protein [Halocatena pleomorpha]